MKLSSIAGLAAALGLAAACAASAQDMPQPGGQPGSGPVPEHAGGRGAMRACREDMARLCAGVERGGGRLMQCMREHKDQLSDGCKSAMAQVRQQRREQHMDGAPAPQDAAPH
jgi:hypothetical protein